MEAHWDEGNARARLQAVSSWMESRVAVCIRLELGLFQGDTRRPGSGEGKCSLKWTPTGP